MSQAETNHENAQHSTGPKTEAGKQRSKYNARKHNLTGQAILSSEEDLKNYFDCSARLVASLRCEGENELRIAHSLADAQWQLDRARAIETNILFQLAVPNMPEDSNDASDWAGAQAKAFLENSKQLDLMSRYATRYHRQVLQLHALLAQTQKERRLFQQDRNKERQQHQRETFAQRQIVGATHNKQKHSAQSGFVSQNASAGGAAGDLGLNPERQRRDSSAKSERSFEKLNQEIA